MRGQGQQRGPLSWWNPALGPVWWVIAAFFGTHLGRVAVRGAYSALTPAQRPLLGLAVTAGFTLAVGLVASIRNAANA